MQAYSLAPDACPVSPYAEAGSSLLEGGVLPLAAIGQDAGHQLVLERVRVGVVGDPPERSRFVHQFLRRDVDLLALLLVGLDAALLVQLVELLGVPALPVPRANLVGGEPLRLEARIELAVVLDEHQL